MSDSSERGSWEEEDMEEGESDAIEPGLFFQGAKRKLLFVGLLLYSPKAEQHNSVTNSGSGHSLLLMPLNACLAHL